jgi:hypothetical protein
MTASRTLDETDASIIKALIAEGWMQSDIASLFQCNIGRISEIGSGQRFGHVAPAKLDCTHTTSRLQRVQTAWLLRIGGLIDQVTRRAA